MAHATPVTARSFGDSAFPFTRALPADTRLPCWLSAAALGDLALYMHREDVYYKDWGCQVEQSLDSAFCSFLHFSVHSCTGHLPGSLIHTRQGKPYATCIHSYKAALGSAISPKNFSQSIPPAS